jgi:hypothetical protein
VGGFQIGTITALLVCQPHRGDGAPVSQQLANELDRLVPAFQDACLGACRQFQAQDALEASRNFLNSTREHSEFGRAIARMSTPERQLFARGYVSEFADRVLELADNWDLLKHAFIQSPAAS